MGIVVSALLQVQSHNYEQAQQVSYKVGVTDPHIDLAHNLINNTIPTRQVI